MKNGYRFVDCDMHVMEPHYLSGGARLYGFTEDGYRKADAACRQA